MVVAGVDDDAEAALAEDLTLLDLLVVDLLDELGRGCRKNGPTRRKGCWLLALTHGLDLSSPAGHGLLMDASVEFKFMMKRLLKRLANFQTKYQSLHSL